MATSLVPSVDGDPSQRSSILGLQARLLVAIAVAIVVPAAVVAAYAIRVATEEMQASIADERLLLVRDKARQVEAQLARPLVDLYYLSQLPQVRATLQTLSFQPTKNEAERALRAFMSRAQDVYARVVVLGPTGSVSIVLSSDTAIGTFAEPEHFRRLFDGANTTAGLSGPRSVYIGSVTEVAPLKAPPHHVVPYALALQNSGGAIQGAIVLEINLRALFGSLASTDGTIPLWVAGSDGALLAQPAGLSAARLAEVFPMAYRDLLDRADGIVRAGAEAGEPARVVARVRPTGQAAIHWTVVSEVPADAALNRVYGSMGTGILLTLGMLVAGLSIGAMLTRRLVAPIRRLAVMAREIGEGRFDQSGFGAERTDEVGALSRAFFAMRDQLNAALTDLNARLLELQRAHAALRDREARIRCLVDSNLIGVFVARLDTLAVLEANPAFLGMVGWDAERFGQGQMNLMDLTVPADRPATLVAQRQLHVEGVCTAYQKKLQRADGSEVPVLIASTRVAGADNEAIGFALDLTDRYRLETERAASRAKSEFLARMSHELRTPLNAIMGYAQIMQVGTVDLPHDHAYSVIYRAGEQLLALINDVLDLARIEAGQMKLETECVDLARLAATSAELVKVAATSKQLSMRVDVDPRLPKYVHGDETKLRQILVNLLSNATKFTHAGSITLSVKPEAPKGAALAGSDTPAGLVSFEVTDTGVGISDADQRRVFKAFEQAGDSRQRAQGTGLGLAISRELVQLMGGTIELRSELGIGTTVKVTLAMSEARPVSRAQERPLSPRARRALVVDDSSSSRSLLREMMRVIGYEVVEADTGAAALKLCRELPPDLLLLDVHLPDISGLDVLRQLRSEQVGRHLHVLAVSAGAMGDQRDAALAAGADGFLPKPVLLPALVEALSRQAALH